ncbi:MAG: YhdH/YhfP family quinone oxidoreductase [Aureliella sp.]
MTPANFRAILVDQNDSSESPAPQSKSNEFTTHSSVVTLSSDRLPEGDVTVQVAYSSLNYKDALAYQGHRGVVKSLPHIPGIDAAGSVINSSSEQHQVGDQVLVTGYDLGQGHWGGWSELIRVPAAWIVPLPKSLTPREAMIYGTAGFTAAQSVMALQRNEVSPDLGEVVVTGATGGVGSLAVRLLSHLGYEVVAVTGKAEQHAALLACGAKRVVGRAEIVDKSTRPLLSATWAGAIDTVGGPILQSLLRSTGYGGCVTACGLVAGADLSMTVYPFLLRGVSLCGIASADCPMAKRRQIWELLAGNWKPNNLDRLVVEVSLEQLPDQVERILAGQIVGRVVVKLET